MNEADSSNNRASTGAPHPLWFGVVFTVALVMMAAHVLGVAFGANAWSAYATPVFVFGVLALADRACGEFRDNASLEIARQIADDWRYRVPVLLCLPAWYALLVWAAWVFGTAQWGVVGAIGWTLSTGLIGGIMAINPAHELIHRRTRYEPIIGGLLLASVNYASFKIEHVRGHHAWVATVHDPSSAREGQGIYSFVARAIALNIVRAWQLEAKRLAQAGKPWWSIDNEMWRWSGLSAAYALAFYAWLGLAGLVFYIAQGLIAAATLEVINYIEHYGLQRQRTSHGHFERVSYAHSWNSPAALSNAYLFNLERHADHHMHAGKRYQVLEHEARAPQLPAGYPAMFLLALVPPLWQRVMHPRLAAYRAQHSTANT